MVGGNLSSVSVAAAAAVFSVISNAATLICLFPLWLLLGSRLIGSSCYLLPFFKKKKKRRGNMEEK